MLELMLFTSAVHQNTTEMCGHYPAKVKHLRLPSGAHVLGNKPQTQRSLFLNKHCSIRPHFHGL